MFAPPPTATTSPFTTSSVPTVTPPPILTRSELRPENGGSAGTGGAAGAVGAGASAGSAGAVWGAGAGGAEDCGSNSARCPEASRYESRIIASASAPRRRFSSAPVTGSPLIAIAPFVSSMDRTSRLARFGVRTMPPCTGNTTNRWSIWRRSARRSVAFCADAVTNRPEQATSTDSRTVFIRPMITPLLNRAAVAASTAPAPRARPGSTRPPTPPAWRARPPRSARSSPASSRR